MDHPVAWEGGTHEDQGVAVVVAAVGLGIDSAMMRELRCLTWLVRFRVARYNVPCSCSYSSHVVMIAQTQSPDVLPPQLHGNPLCLLSTNSLSGIGPSSLGKSLSLSDDGASDDGASAADLICVGVCVSMPKTWGVLLACEVVLIGQVQ